MSNFLSGYACLDLSVDVTMMMLTMKLMLSEPVGRSPRFFVGVELDSEV